MGKGETGLFVVLGKLGLNSGLLLGRGAGAKKRKESTEVRVWKGDSIHGG